MALRFTDRRAAPARVTALAGIVISFADPNKGIDASRFVAAGVDPQPGTDQPTVASPESSTRETCLPTRRA
jgi:hypothetical protein